MTDSQSQVLQKELELIGRKLPLIWPGPSEHSQGAEFEGWPPGLAAASAGELVSAVLVGVGDRAVQWLADLVGREGSRRVSVVVVLMPAGPTRVSHLNTLLDIANSVREGKTVDVRLLTMRELSARDSHCPVVPPTTIQGHDPKTGRTALWIGSVADVGCAPYLVGSLNFVFEPGEALRDQWRRSFGYVRAASVPLTAETAQVPHLVPARGDADAARLWAAYEQTLAAVSGSGRPSAGPQVNPETGEVEVDVQGAQVAPWDGGCTALDPLAQELHRVYGQGALVTVDQTSRIKPLSVPVRAALLDEQGERFVGAVKQKQSFSLQALDDSVERKVEKCRTVSDIVALLGLALSPGHRWVSDAAQGLLNSAVEERDRVGREALKTALGGTVPEFIKKHAGRLRKDLDDMYKALGRGIAVPDRKADEILGVVRSRLEAALAGRVTPRPVYNRIQAPSLSPAAPDENWNQPLSLLLQAARLPRESEADPYFPRRLAGTGIDEDALLAACNVFDDQFLDAASRRRATEDLAALKEIELSPLTAREKCHHVWDLMHPKRGQRGSHG
jgi:hypothetical protein